MCMDNGGSTTDTFDGIEFKWTSIKSGRDDVQKSNVRDPGAQLCDYAEGVTTGCETWRGGEPSASCLHADGVANGGGRFDFTLTPRISSLADGDSLKNASEQQ